MSAGWLFAVGFAYGAVITLAVVAGLMTAFRRRP